MVIDELVFRIEAQLADARKDIAAVRGQMAKAEGGAKKLVDSFKRFAGFAGAAVAVQQVTRALVQFGKESIQAASRAEEVRSKFSVVFKDSANDVERWARDFSASLGRATTDNLAFLSTIQDTLVPLGLARDEAAEMSKSVVELATDLSSFNDIPTDQVLAAIQSALVGNTETLRQFGVVANQARLEEIALAEGINEVGSELDGTEKALAVYEALLRDTTDAQGDAARTMSSWANQNRQAESSVTTLKEQVGILLQEGFRPLKAVFIDLTTNLGNLVGKMNDARRALDAWAELKEEASDENLVAAIEAEQLALENAQNALESFQQAGVLDQQIRMLTGTSEQKLRAEVEVRRATLEALDDQYTAATDRLAVEAEITAEAERQQEIETERAEAARQAVNEEALRQEQVTEARESALADYQNQLMATQTLQEQGFIAEKQALEDQLAAAERYVQDLAQLGFNAMIGGQTYTNLADYQAAGNAGGRTDAGLSSEFGDVALLEMTAIIDELRERLASFNDETDDAGDRAGDVGDELSFWEEHLKHATEYLKEQNDATEALARLESEMAEAQAAGDEGRVAILAEMQERLERILNIEETRTAETEYYIRTYDDFLREREQKERELLRILRDQEKATANTITDITTIASSAGDGIGDFTQTAISTIGSIGGPVGSAIAGVINAILDPWIDAMEATMIQDDLEASSDRVTDLFDQVLNGEEDLQQQRLDAVEEELAAAQRAHDEQMALLNSRFSTEQRILEERYERGLISESQFRTGASALSEDQATAVGAAQTEMDAAASAAEDSRAFENTKQQIVAGLEQERRTLINDFNSRFSGLGLSSYDDYQPGTPYPFILSTWGQADELLHGQIDRVRGAIAAAGQAGSLEELAGIPSFASGGSFVTGGEQLIRVGEAGPERVDIRPVNSIAEGRGAGGGIHVYIDRAYGIDDLAGQVGAALDRRLRRGVGVRD